MKKSISTMGIITVIVLFLGSTSITCTKKKDSMAVSTVTMTYLPNPALKDTLITVSFLVKSDDMPMNVTNYSCSYKLSTGTSSNPMTLTQGTTGSYTGTCTFNAAGMYNVSMMYMHGMDNMTKDFSITVQ